MASIGSRPAGGRRTHWLALEGLAYGVMPVAIAASILGVWLSSSGDGLGFDLRHAYLPAGRDVLDGVSPYPSPGDPSIAGQHAYVYTPVLAFAVAPLTVLSATTAVKLGIVASFAAALAVLALAGVRDWRCYGIVVMWPPVLNSAENVSVSLFLVVILAASWRYRDRELISGALLGTAVAVKTFAWPLLAWPAVVGRRRGALVGVGFAIVLSLGTWAVLGFAGLRGYPDLLRAVTDLEERESYSLSGAALELGAGEAVARAVMVAVTLGLICLAVALGRRHAERRAFVALLFASLAATPILWQHYLTLLLLALAVARPRLSPGWLLPLALYVAPWTGNGALWQTLLVPLVTTLVGIACLMPNAPVLGRDIARRYSSSPRSGVSTSPRA